MWSRREMHSAVSVEENWSEAQKMRRDLGITSPGHAAHSATQELLELGGDTSVCLQEGVGGQLSSRCDSSRLAPSTAALMSLRCRSTVWDRRAARLQARGNRRGSLVGWAVEVCVLHTPWSHTIRGRGNEAPRVAK